MNVHVNQEAIRQHQQHQAVRARLMAAAVRMPKPATLVAEQPKGPRPAWKNGQVFFNQHVVDYRRYLSKRNVNPMRVYLQERAAELGFTLGQMTGRNRTRDISKARQLLMFEIHQKFKRSTVEVGMLFGGRDHTTVQWALMKHGHRPRLTKGLSPKQIEEIKRLTAKGAPAVDLAEKFRVSLTTIRNHTIEGYREANDRRNAMYRERRAMDRARIKAEQKKGNA